MTEDNGWFSEETATFGDRLAGAREAAGLDQKALAERLGVKQTTIASWEDDLKEPRANRLQMMAGMLGVSISWLLTGQGDGPDAPNDSDPNNDLLEMLSEMRLLRSQVTEIGEQMARLEKRMRKRLKDVE